MATLLGAATFDIFMSYCPLQGAYGGAGGGSSSYMASCDPNGTEGAADQHDAFDLSEYRFMDVGGWPQSSEPLPIQQPDANLAPSGSSSRRRNEENEGLQQVQRIGFRTKSEVEIMDDGFKWRKYGKKYIKNSPNPRNYYRCSTDGCMVKKRVEREREDPSYVITTYDGIHNHTSPGVVYYATQDERSGRFLVTGQMPPHS